MKYGATNVTKTDLKAFVCVQTQMNAVWTGRAALMASVETLPAASGVCAELDISYWRTAA